MKPVLKNKKGGVVTSTVMGIGGLIIAVIIMLVIVNTLYTADLLVENSTANATVSGMVSNFTIGLSEVSGKLPTILLIVAVVFLFGALVMLVQQARNMGVGESSSL